MFKSVPRALLLILLLALALRIFPATYNYVIGTDEALYLTLGQHLAAGDGFTADGIHPHTEFDPGYPLFAALIDRLFGITANAEASWAELPARLNLLLLGALLAVPIYFLARELYPPDDSRAEKKEQLAWRAALLTAAAPALVLGVPNFEAASEQLYALALWTGWLFAWLSLKQGRWYFLLLSGLAFGLAHITRWEGAISAGVAFAVVLVASLFDALHPPLSAPRSRLLAPQYSLIFLAGFLLLAAPYAAYQRAQTGTIFSNKAIIHQLHGEALASADPLAWEKDYDLNERVRADPAAYPSLPVYLWEHRAQTITNYARNTVSQIRLMFTSPTFLFILWLPFALIGILQMRRRQNLFLAATLVPILIFPLAVIDGRYLLPFIPAGMIWAARGLMVADEWLKSRTSSMRLHLSNGFTFALVAIFIAVDIGAMFFIPRPVEYRAAGIALRGQIPAGAVVLMRRRQIAFYANAQFEIIPFSDLSGTLADAASKDANFLVLDARTALSTRPQLAFLLDPHNSPSSLQLMYDSQSAPRVVVYRISAP